jgi:VCBS repeat-containing protein
MRVILVGGFFAKVPRLSPAKVVALLAAVLGAVVALGLVASAASAETFSNTDGITINDGAENCFGGPPASAPGKADPYPSEVAVDGLGSVVTDVDVTISGLSHAYPDDIGLLLVSPAGHSTILMADSGFNGGVSDITLTFDDAAPGGLPDSSQLSSGTYKPSVGSVEEGCAAPQPFPEAPAGPYGSSLSVFNGTNPNGAWKLYVIDDNAFDTGSITGWSLNISSDNPPTAEPDSYSTNEDTELSVAAPGVLSNDTDLDSGDTLKAVLESGPSHGTLTLNANGSFTYTPATNFSGSDSFTYKANDGKADSGVATVSISVNAVNDAPTVDVAGGSCGTNDRSGTINLTLGDPEGDAMSLTLISNTNTTLVPDSNVVLGGTGANRTLTATAVSGRTGRADLTIRVSDGVATSDLKLTVKVDGNGSRTTGGTGGTDMIFGQNGDDVLNGSAGNDLLCGGRGNDTLNGGAGDDTMGGGLGADRFSGDDGTNDKAKDFTPSQGDTKNNTVETF